MVWQILTLACAEDSRRVEPANPEAIAIYEGRELTLAEIEALLPAAKTSDCLAVHRALGSATLEQLVPCYRDVARTLAIERLVTSELGDLETARELLDEDTYRTIRNRAYLQPFRESLRERIEVSDEEVEAHFEAHREDYRSPGRLTLSNLFRRHDDPEDPQATLDLLAKWKSEYEAGRPFEQLAREHSHSETRLRGGKVGPIATGELPKRLEDVAFGLADGEVSDPILVRGGAVLLHVRSPVAPIESELWMVRDRIRNQLVAERVQQAMDDRISARQVSDQEVVLSDDELLTTLDQPTSEGEDAVVLAVGDNRWTATQVRAAVGLLPHQTTANLDEEERRNLLDLYRDRYRVQALVAELLAEAEELDHQRAEATIRDETLPLVVDQVLRTEMEEAVDGDPDALERYFEDNRAHYQTTLQFDLEIWDLPFGDDPPKQLREMEVTRRKLLAGETDLAQASRTLGGTVRDVGWRAFDELGAVMPNKARQYLLAGEGSYTVPYQQDQALHMVHVRQRQEPGPVAYDDVKSRVKKDYVRRFEQRLFNEIVDRRLEAAKFEFRAEALKRSLSSEGSTRPKSP